MKTKKYSCLDKFNKAYARIIKESMDMEIDGGGKKPYGNLTEEEEQRLLAMGFKRGDETGEELEGYLWYEDTENEDYEARDGMWLYVDDSEMSLTLHNTLAQYEDYPEDVYTVRQNVSLDEFKKGLIPALTDYINSGKLEELEEYQLKCYKEDDDNPNMDVPGFKKDLQFAKQQMIKFLEKLKTL